MNKYTICVVDRSYRYVEVKAEKESEARDKVWSDLESILRKEPDEIDTDIIIEEVTEVKQSDRLPTDWVI